MSGGKIFQTKPLDGHSRVAASLRARTAGRPLEEVQNKKFQVRDAKRGGGGGGSPGRGEL